VSWLKNERARIGGRVAATPATVRRVVPYIAAQRRHGLLLLAVVVAQSIAGLVPILVVRDFTAASSRSSIHFGHLAVLLSAALGAMLAVGLLNVGRRYLGARIAQAVVTRVRQEVFEHLLGQTVAFHIRTRAGELTSRLFNDIGAIDFLLSDTLATLAESVVTAVAAFVIMLVFDWELTVAALLVLPATAIAFRFASRTMFWARDAVQRQLAELAALAQEHLGLSAILLIRSFGREPLVRERFSAQNQLLREKEMRLAVTSSWLTFASSTLIALGPTLLVLVGAYQLSEHQVSLATLLAFGTLIVGRFGPAMHGMTTGAGAVVGSTALWTRLFEVLDAEPEIRSEPGARRLEHCRGVVAFDHVTYTYPGQSRPAVADVSFTAEPGQLVALVGPSGAGKTTITSLLARFVDPHAGSVRIDGHDLRDLTLPSLSDAIGSVFQDNFLFHATVGENLRVGNPSATEEMLERVVRQAFLDELIAELPEGFETLVGERGHRLSGGEKQRFAIARVMLKDPPILILDEATSHLDTASERMIQTALNTLFRERTSLVVAHRLSTILAADLIIVVEKGRIVERGTHAELLDRGGLYADLYELQFGGGGAQGRLAV
jgi:ATP-binding cassette subfamily B protein